MKTKSSIALLVFQALFAPALAEEEPLLKLTKGDTWDYRVVVEAPHGAVMPGGEDIAIKKTVEGVRATFKKSRVYAGKTKPKADRPAFDTFQMVRSGRIVEFEFSDFQKDAVYALGSKDTTRKESPVVLLNQPLLIYSSANQPGDRWEIKSGDGVKSPLFNREFRIFGEEEVEVPAGKFTGVRIVMTGLSGQTEIKRTVWFAKGVGFVKEEKTYYSDSKRLIHQTMELTNFKKGQ